MSECGDRRRRDDAGRPRLGLLILLVGAWVLVGSSVPCVAADNGGTDISRILSLPGAIPGTDAYRHEQAGGEISIFLSDLDAIQDARVVLKEDGDGRLGGLIALKMQSPESWDRPLADAVIGIATTCAPAINPESLQIIDGRGRVLNRSGSAGVSGTGPPAAEGDTEFGPLLIILGGLLAGLIGAGAWWYTTRFPQAPQPEQTDETWAFLRQADPDAVAAAFDGLRPEMVGAVTAGLDETTREHVMSSLPTRSIPDASPEDQMHPEIDAQLHQLLRERVSATTHGEGTR